MSITVIVCTYNRCQLLERALESIALSSVPNTVRWEVLVVDNNSTDRTAEVVREVAGRYPERFRYLFESEQGKSFALNTAIEAAQGDALVFTDDDVIVRPDWLWCLAAPLESGEWAGAGGRIVSIYNKPFPRWLAPTERMLEGPFVGLDLGPDPIRLTQSPVGANMAFRREMFERYGGFRTNLGRIGGTLRCGEDTEFAKRLLARGEKLVYVPGAVVYHPVPESRMRKGYLLEWFYSNGRFNLSRSGLLAPTQWTVAGVPLYLFRRLGRWSAQWLVSRGSSERFQCVLNLSTVAGTIRGCHELAMAKRRGGAEWTSPATEQILFDNRRGNAEGSTVMSEVPKMTVSVIVCTYNRSAALERALTSIAASRVPGSVCWEVIVVDNNSSDQTSRVVEALASRHPGRFRYLLETRQGLSHARNAGISAAQSEILVFTDDDVVVDRNWLWNISLCLAGGAWCGAGGRIVPKWDHPLPDWLALDEFLLSGPMVALDLSPVPVEMHSAPVGANMAFRREAFQRYGGFRTDLGRIGDDLRGGEDAEFAQRLLDAGERICYEPEAMVEHPIPEARLQKDYLLSWFFGHGRSRRHQCGLPAGGAAVGGVPVFLLRRYGRWTIQGWLSLKTSKRFGCRLKARSIAGDIAACQELARLSKGKAQIAATTSTPGID